MKAQELKKRLNNILTWNFKTEIATEKAFVNKQIKKWLDSNDNQLPSKFDMSENAVLWSLLLQAKKELQTV
jgi:hypothetical protein